LHFCSINLPSLSSDRVIIVIDCFLFTTSTESPGVLVIAPKVEDVHETITSSLGSSWLCNESDERVQAGDTSVAEIQRHVSERIHAIPQQLPLEITTDGQADARPAGPEKKQYHT